MPCAEPLVPLHGMPRPEAFSVPSELYAVLLGRAPLFGMPYPSFGRDGWHALHELGLRRVVRLEAHGMSYDPAPLVSAGIFDVTDLAGGFPPPDPESERRVIAAAVAAVLGSIEAGEGVVVHCQGGTGRTGTVIGASLVALGHAPDTVIPHLDALHRARGRAGWPESKWQAELVHGWGRDASGP